MHSSLSFPSDKRGLHRASPLLLSQQLSSPLRNSRVSQMGFPIHTWPHTLAFQMCPEKCEFQWWILSFLKLGGVFILFPTSFLYWYPKTTHTPPHTPESDANELPQWFKNIVSLKVVWRTCLICRYLCPAPRDLDSIGQDCDPRTHILTSSLGDS